MAADATGNRRKNSFRSRTTSHSLTLNAACLLCESFVIDYINYASFLQQHNHMYMLSLCDKLIFALRAGDLYFALSFRNAQLLFAIPAFYVFIKLFIAPACLRAFDPVYQGSKKPVCEIRNPCKPPLKAH